MALFTYSVKYRFTCEECGKQTDWLTYSVTQDAGNLKSLAAELKIWAKDVADQTNTPDAVHAFLALDHADEVPIDVYLNDNHRIKKVHDRFHEAIDTGDLSVLSCVCPSCGRRQSWCPKKSLFKKKTESSVRAEDAVEIDWTSEKVDIHR